MPNVQPNRNNTEKYCNELLCCCMPCIEILGAGENMCKGIFLGVLWILSCPCIILSCLCFSKKCIIPCQVTPNSEVNIEEENIEEENEDVFEIEFSEETKDANNQ